jgi:poly(hydroxyalkanoate) granule associated protein phasin
MKTDRPRPRTASRRRSPATGRPRARPTGRIVGLGADLRKRWQAALAALDERQRELQRQLGALRRGRLNPGSLSEGLQAVRLRLDRERRKATHDLEKTLSALQARFREQRSLFADRMEETLRRTLAAFDVPSRQEVTILIRRVEQLSRKIDRLPPTAKTPGRRRTRARA